MSHHLSLYGLTFNPFGPDILPEDLLTAPAVNCFVQRIEPTAVPSV